MIDVKLALGDLREPVDARLERWTSSRAIERLWSRDTTLWAPDPPPPELADRLGWLDLPETSAEVLPDLAALRGEVPFWMTDQVLLGMGGSSLAPEVLARTLGAGGLPLTVMDSTHPAAVRDLEWINPANTIFIVASKSGTTLETLSLFRHFWSRTREVTDDPGSQFVAVTDPGSALAELARERGFRAVFEASPDVGGRFSALTTFGLVPAALMGLDIARILAGASEAAEVCREPPGHNPGARLAAALAELAALGRDKVTFVTGSPWEAFPDWAEQLLAESTGKDGTGLVPVAHEPARDPGSYGDDVCFVGLVAPPEVVAAAGEWGEVDEAPETLEALEAAGHPVVRIEIEEPEDIGALFFVWEVAVSLAGAAMDIHPFNQPDVQLAKDMAKRAMGGEDVSGERDEDDELDLAWDAPRFGHAAAGAPPRVDPDALGARVIALLDSVDRGDYVALQAYLAGGDPDELEELQALRAAISAATGASTTLGYGPRFLHSTGQLHKGGANTGVFLQLVDDAGPHVHVPESDFTFGELIRAQARGDLAALDRRDRRVLRVRVGPEGTGIRRLRQLVEQA